MPVQKTFSFVFSNIWGHTFPTLFVLFSHNNNKRLFLNILNTPFPLSLFVSHSHKWFQTSFPNSYVFFTKFTNPFKEVCVFLILLKNSFSLTKTSNHKTVNQYHQRKGPELKDKWIFSFYLSIFCIFKPLEWVAYHLLYFDTYNKLHTTKRGETTLLSFSPQVIMAIIW